MELEEAKEQLKDLINDRKSFLSGDAEHDEIYLKDIEALEIAIAELHAIQNLLDEKNDEIDRLQKENEELKDIDLTIVHLKGVCDEKERWRNKIREMLEDYKKGVDCTYCNNTCSRYILCTNLQDLLKEE